MSVAADLQSCSGLPLGSQEYICVVFSVQGQDDQTDTE